MNKTEYQIELNEIITASNEPKILRLPLSVLKIVKITGIKLVQSVVITEIDSKRFIKQTYCIYLLFFLKNNDLFDSLKSWEFKNPTLVGKINHCLILILPQIII